jgi:hypothetical protein
MNSQNLCSICSQGRTDKAMTSEQFTQVIEAILAGKYSWACLLILRFAGYNPLHYIPYRTFNRLVKENTPSRKSGQTKPDEPLKSASVTHIQAKSTAQNTIDKIPDLAYLNSLDREEPVKVRGGYRLTSWWGDRLQPYHR